MLTVFFMKDFGIEIVESDRVPYAVHDIEQKASLLLFQPHEGFDYDEFIKLLLNDTYELEGYYANTVEESKGLEEAIFDAKIRRQDSNKLDWWRPDESSDVRFVVIRVACKTDENRLYHRKMFFFISKQDGLIYVCRYMFPDKYN